MFVTILPLRVAEHFQTDFDLIFCLPSFCLDNLTPGDLEKASLSCASSSSQQCRKRDRVSDSLEGPRGV